MNTLIYTLKTEGYLPSSWFKGRLNHLFLPGRCWAFLITVCGSWVVTNENMKQHEARIRKKKKSDMQKM